MVYERIFNVREQRVLLAELHVALRQLDVCYLALDSLSLVLIRILGIFVERLLSVAVYADSENVPLVGWLAFRLLRRDSLDALGSSTPLAL